MDPLVSFAANGGEVLIEVASTTGAGGPTVRGLGATSAERLVATADKSLAEAVGRAVPAAIEVLGAVEKASVGPTEITISFGIGLTAGADAFIASATTSANFEVTLVWKREQAGSGPATPETA